MEIRTAHLGAGFEAGLEARQASKASRLWNLQRLGVAGFMISFMARLPPMLPMLNIVKKKHVYNLEWCRLFLMVRNLQFASSVPTDPEASEQHP
jgi:hypothetical protein